MSLKHDVIWALTGFGILLFSGVFIWICWWEAEHRRRLRRKRLMEQQEREKRRRKNATTRLRVLALREPTLRSSVTGRRPRIVDPSVPPPED